MMSECRTSWFYVGEGTLTARLLFTGSLVREDADIDRACPLRCHGLAPASHELGVHIEVDVGIFSRRRACGGPPGLDTRCATVVPSTRIIVFVLHDAGLTVPGASHVSPASGRGGEVNLAHASHYCLYWTKRARGVLRRLAILPSPLPPSVHSSL